MADDLAVWLTQIWDQDEAGWKTQAHAEAEGVYKPLFHFGRLLTEEMLARIAADRQILALHTGNHECPYWDGNGEWWEDLYCPVALLLALPYADRPGYQGAWRPGYQEDWKPA